VLLCWGTSGRWGKGAVIRQCAGPGLVIRGIGEVINILLDWTSRSWSGIHDSTLMSSCELTFDLFPSPFRRLDRWSREFTVGPGFFDELHDPLRTVVL
jgi:hypothetical protein